MDNNPRRDVNKYDMQLNFMTPQCFEGGDNE